ncbi:hypothetical protein TREPR_2583 [Treponema primitia ZAS-2]|uniref:Uncharacterized protein n=1 Tax=Treponema primitia (strain ATCC BAA-887 / DSM 12427 / ZAS-2) TaxID=545694 RepID=F5YGJ7_TREPZ|nr:hypothetical protein TREPR_2583 [Treponema primitia ZAS-2]
MISAYTVPMPSPRYIISHKKGKKRSWIVADRDSSHYFSQKIARC